MIQELCVGGVDVIVMRTGSPSASVNKASVKEYGVSGRGMDVDVGAGRFAAFSSGGIFFSNSIDTTLSVLSVVW